MIERWTNFTNCNSEALFGFCATEGCDAMTIGDEYCARCREEIDALAAMAAQKDERQEPLRARFVRVGAVVQRRLWIAELLFVGLGLMYIGGVYGAALLDWLER